MRKFSAFLFCFLIAGIFNFLASQNNYEVIKGERPPINYDLIDEDAYEKGILIIKFIPDMIKHLEGNPILKSNSGTVLFGIDAVDALNQKFGIEETVQHFLSPSFGNTFTERHKAWGFHLWYQLKFDARTDVKQLVREYSAINEIEIAEPSFIKVMIGHVDYAEILAPDGGNKQGSEDMKGIAWTPNDPMYSTQWHYHNTGQQGGTPDADIDLPEAWDIEKGNSSVIVAIIDDGIQFNHPDIAGNMWSGIGYNFVAGNSTVVPGNHGTHVAGTVAAVNNNGVGVAGVAGGSGSGNGVRLMSCQVFTSSSAGGFHLAPIYAADNGAAISQNSWSYNNPGVYDQNVLDAIDYFNANGGGTAMINGGITIFAAANNNSSAQYYPAYYSGTLAVAATNNQDIKAYYSNYGTWVDISAPGGETWGNSSDARGVRSTITGSTYAYYEGTSMACPHASGVAALIISLGYGSFTPTDVKSILKNTTDNINAVNPGYIGQLGTGRLNAHSALILTQSLLSGVQNPASFTATPASTTQINLAWTKNSNNNSVMAVWSPTGIFGTPVNGTVYNAGQSIPGGGTVLYRGANATYNHTGLTPSTLYYYKAFSYDTSNEYSPGISAQASTLCGVFTLPFSENFNATPPAPICWEVIDNQGNGQVWQFGTFSGGVSGTGGNYAYLNSDGYGSGNSQNSDLVTPTLDLSGMTNITLSFQHYFREYSGSSGVLAYSINNGGSWTTIQSWTTTTTNPATFNQVIAAVAGQSQVKFRWKYVGTWGYYWSVDNVSITGSPSGPPPVANFSADNTTPVVGQTVNFTDLSTNNPTSWNWTFTPGTVTYVGGTNATSQNPQVQFNAGGTYTVSLTATNSYGSNTETKTNYINVPYPPVADFDADTYTPMVGMAVYFWDMSINNPTEWQWSFNPPTVSFVNGTTAQSQDPEVQFNAGGTYDVTLTATNAAGNNTVTKFGFITAYAPPIADFSADNTNPATGATVYLSDLSQNSPTSWQWSFNPSTISYMGGTTANSQNPQVRFNASGYYTVSLMISNFLGSDTETKADYIYASQAGLWTGAISPDWNMPSNWDDNLVPTSSVEVTIPNLASNWPVLNGNLILGTTCNDLTMLGSSELTVAGNIQIPSGKILTSNGNSIIRLSGNWLNSGTFSPGSGTVDFYGSQPSQIDLSSTFYYISENFNTFPGSWQGNTSTSPGANNFYQIATTNAGGTTPEVRYQRKTSVSSNEWRRIYYGPINTAGLTSLTLEFKHMVDDRNNSGYTLYAQYSTNGSTWNPTSWSVAPSSDIPATTVTVPLGTSQGVGSSTYYIAFAINGDLRRIDYWYIDDVKLFTSIPVSEFFNDLTINKTDAHVATSANITINSNFTILPNARFTNSIGNSLTVLGSSLFRSDATGMSSFIDNGTSSFAGDPQVQLYLTPDSWHFVSAPVSGALSGLFTDNYLYSFDESTDSWFNIIPTDIPLNIMQGYSVWVPTNPALLTFTGALNNGPFSIPVTRNTTQTDQGWNLVGNPYPSALDWNSPAWTKTNVNNTIYYYQGAGGLNNYRYYVGTGGETPGIGVNSGTNEIPPLQGFFVHASGTGTLGVNNNACIHSTQAYYKSGEELSDDWPLIRIVAEANGLTDETVIRFVSAATPDFDGDFDAFKLFADNYPQVWSAYGNTDYAVNTLPEVNDDLVIPVSFEHPEATDYTLHFSEINGMPGQVMFLEDLLLNEIHEVEVNKPFFFNYVTVHNSNRFLLHFSHPLGLHDNKALPLSIYSYGNSVYVDLKDNQAALVIIYDMLGREIFSQKSAGEKLLRIDLEKETGYYIVTVQTGVQMIQKKVLIR